MAISIEATRNVVEHAYADREQGAVELSIELLGHASSGAGGEHSSGDVLVCVRDTGDGCPLTATSSDPPGLGLAMISELSESMTLHSDKGEGTEVEATVHFGANGSREATSPSLHESFGDGGSTPSELAFGDPSFLTPILPRVMAAHAAGGEAAIDALGVIVERGRALAQHLADDVEPVPISIGVDAGGECVEVRIGPLPAADARSLRESVEGGSGGHERVSLDPGAGDEAHVLIQIPLH